MCIRDRLHSYRSHKEGSHEHTKEQDRTVSYTHLDVYKRQSHDRNGGLAILNGICKAYLTIIRGTPVMIQLLIIYYVVLASVTNKILVAVIAFGLNSAAYLSLIHI